MALQVNEEIVNNTSDTDSVISVRKFLLSWDTDTALLSVPSSGRKENGYIAQQMGISKDLADELTVVCGVDTLKCGQEPVNKTDLLRMKGLPKDLNLTCVKYQERDLERRKLIDYKLFVMNKMKYRMLDVLQIPPNPNTPVEEKNKVPQPNVVIIIKVYRPRLHTNFLPKGEVFQVLGTQPLTALKDSISCVKDDAIAGDFSEQPYIPNEELTPAKDIYKSGMFFIENTFYNDMREPDNIDYSETICKWAEEKNHESYPYFHTARMEDTLFMDLNIQLGVPYLYQHQGNCEHIIIFTDLSDCHLGMIEELACLDNPRSLVLLTDPAKLDRSLRTGPGIRQSLRLLHPEDPQDITMYPYLLSETVTKRTVCRACAMDSAKWVVYESQLTPESPCFMCHNCFILLHYDSEGNKVCPFKAFKYRQKIGPP